MQKLLDVQLELKLKRAINYVTINGRKQENPMWLKRIIQISKKDRAIDRRGGQKN